MIKKKFLLFSFLLLTISASLIIFEIVRNNSKQDKVCFEDYCFYVELPKTPQKMAQGLMFRESLDLDKGMLFIFEEEKEYPFWMKNTLISLDIIWINQGKEVVFIGKDIQPCLKENCESIKPDKKAKYVLELNAGMTDKIGLKIGDRLMFDID